MRTLLFTGADLLIDFREKGGMYLALLGRIAYSLTAKRAHIDDEYHRVNRRPEQVFGNGYELQQTLSGEAVAVVNDSFIYDPWSGRRDRK